MPHSPTCLLAHSPACRYTLDRPGGHSSNYSPPVYVRDPLSIGPLKGAKQQLRLVFHNLSKSMCLQGALWNYIPAPPTTPWERDRHCNAELRTRMCELEMQLHFGGAPVPPAPPAQPLDGHLCYGAVIRLRNTGSPKLVLVNHDKGYPKQPDGTLVASAEFRGQPHELWEVLPASPNEVPVEGEAVADGSLIRLEHFHLKRALCSADEVLDGKGARVFTATSAHEPSPKLCQWRVVWEGGALRLQHASSSKYLAASGEKWAHLDYEVSLSASKDTASLWQLDASLPPGASATVGDGRWAVDEESWHHWPSSAGSHPLVSTSSKELWVHGSHLKVPEQDRKRRAAVV
eukprot:5339798-Prymnesium_polylepis.1